MIFKRLFLWVISGNWCLENTGHKVSSSELRDEIPDGTLYSPDGTLYSPDGTLYSPDGTLYSPDGTLHSRDWILYSRDWTLHPPN